MQLRKTCTLALVAVFFGGGVAVGAPSDKVKKKRKKADPEVSASPTATPFDGRFSQLVVNDPAQLYRINNLFGVAAATFTNDMEVSSEESSTTVRSQSTAIPVFGVFRLPVRDIKVALGYQMETATDEIAYEIAGEPVEVKSKEKATSIEVGLSFPVTGRIHVGGLLTKVGSEDTNDDTDESTSITYQKFEPSIAALMGNVEVLVEYVPPINVKDGNRRVRNPAQVALHADWAFRPSISLGAGLTHNRHTSVKEDGKNTTDPEIYVGWWREAGNFIIASFGVTSIATDGDDKGSTMILALDASQRVYGNVAVNALLGYSQSDGTTSAGNESADLKGTGTLIQVGATWQN